RLLLAEELRDVFPIDQVVDEGLEVVGTAVAVVYVVGVLPDVDAEDRLAAMDERALPVLGLGGFDLAVLQGEPRPARAELGHARLDQVFLGLVDRAERVLERLLDLAGDRSAAVRLHPPPEVQVVEVLSGVIEHRGVLAERAFDNLLSDLPSHSVPLIALLPLLT